MFYFGSESEDDNDSSNNVNLFNNSIKNFTNGTNNDFDSVNQSSPQNLSSINEEMSATFNAYQQSSMPLNLKNVPQINVLGRKKKHTKRDRDNKTYKFKVRIEKALLELINPKIKDKNLQVMINGKIENIVGILKINRTEKKNSTIDGNIKLLSKSIKDFFNTDIADNYPSKPKDYNKRIINILYNSDNCKDITSILDMSFLECIKYYRKDINSNNPKYSCLEGLQDYYDKLEEEFSNNKEYLKELTNLIKKFEIIYSKKKR